MDSTASFGQLDIDDDNQSTVIADTRIIIALSKGRWVQLMEK